MPPARLRQIALVASDIKEARRILTKILCTEVIHVDPGVGIWGLENILLAIGGDVLEVVSPTRPGTAAGRTLQKRGGDGGYMLIMQTLDAAKRKDEIVKKGQGKVIFEHEVTGSICIQYHPKGIKGGVIPELDEHYPSSSNPNPIESRFSPWHACGPDYATYSAGMKRNAHIRFSKVACRLTAGDSDTEAAARQWEDMFGIPRIRDALQFTNTEVIFLKGEKDKPEGIESITVAVDSKDMMEKILERVQDEDRCGDGWTNMLGIKWYFVVDGPESKL